MIFLLPRILDLNRVKSTLDLSNFHDENEVDIVTLVEGVYSANACENKSIDVQYAIDDAVDDKNDNEFEDVTIRVTERFKRNGVRYVSDGSIAIDFDAYVMLVHGLVSPEQPQ